VWVCAWEFKLQKECRAGHGIAVAGWRRFPRDEPDDPDFSVGFAANGQSRDRTGDLRIFSPSLYQLSYLSLLPRKDLRHCPRPFLWPLIRYQNGAYRQ